MHELPVIERVLNLALAEALPGYRIVTVTLRVGALCDAQPDWLERYFRLAAGGTVAEGARLEIFREEAALYCPACGKESILAFPLDEALSCTICGYAHVTLVAGLDYQLESIEVAPDAAM